MAGLDFLSALSGAATGMKERQAEQRQQEDLLKRMSEQARLQDKNNRRNFNRERKLSKADEVRTGVFDAQKALVELPPEERIAAGFLKKGHGLQADEVAKLEAAAAVRDSQERKSLLEGIDTSSASLGDFDTETPIRERPEVLSPGLQGPTRPVLPIGEVPEKGLKKEGTRLEGLISKREEGFARLEREQKAEELGIKRFNSESQRLAAESIERDRSMPVIEPLSKSLAAKESQRKTVADQLPTNDIEGAITWPIAERIKNRSLTDEQIEKKRLGLEAQLAVFDEEIAQITLDMRNISTGRHENPDGELPEQLPSDLMNYASNFAGAPSDEAWEEDVAGIAEFIPDPQQRDLFVDAASRQRKAWKIANPGMR